MRILYCWRCRMELPMLEDDEWAVVMAAHRVSYDQPDEALAVLDAEARRRGLPPVPRPPANADALDRRLWHMLASYQLFTGVAETVANAVWHHRASRYGPPCEHCGKPLRTPLAHWCPACGGWRTDPPERKSAAQAEVRSANTADAVPTSTGSVLSGLLGALRGWIGPGGRRRR